MRDYKKVYNEFWKSIVERKGRINKTQLMKELFDWHYVMKQIPKVYCEVTNSRLSKVMYSAETVIGVYHEELTNNYLDKESVRHDIADILMSKNSSKTKLREIKEYLEIEDI